MSCVLVGNFGGLSAHMPQIRQEKFDVAFTVGEEQPTFIFFSVLESRLGTGSIDGPNIMMEGVRRQHEHHTTKRTMISKRTGWFTILLLHLLQSYAATCAATRIILKLTGYTTRQPEKSFLS